MLFVVLFTDKQGCGHIRSQYSQKHIEWLETHKEVIPVGGSLRVVSVFKWFETDGLIS